MSFFQNLYPLEQKIISSGNGDIYSTSTKVNGCEVIVKVAKWDKTQSQCPREIIHNLRLNTLPGINKMLDFHYSIEPVPNRFGTYYIVCERKPMDLYSYLEKKELDEKQCKVILHKILQILCEMGNRTGLMHMDIKEENVLIDPATMDVELCDVEFCVPSCIEWVKCDKEGTLSYMAPECLGGKCCPLKSIVWSFGILTYSVLIGDVPWECYKKGMHFKADMYENLSQNAKDFISFCLQPDTRTRPSLLDLVTHPWFLSEEKDI